MTSDQFDLQHGQRERGLAVIHDIVLGPDIGFI